MATETDIDIVKTNLHSDAGQGDDPFDDVHITNLLDSGLTTSETIRNYWQYRMAHMSDYVDITESGSSRQLGTLWQRAKDMADYWAQQVRDEAAEEEVISPSKTAARVHTSVRI